MARAVDSTTIGFDVIPNGTALTDGIVLGTQYHALGIDFGPVPPAPPGGEFGGSGFPVSVRADAAEARSAPNVATTSCRKEFCDNDGPFYAKFDPAQPRFHVSVFATNYRLVGGISATLTGFDAAGNEIQSDGPVEVSRGTWTELSIDLPRWKKNPFAYIRVDGAGVAVDDLTFDRETGAPAPPTPRPSIEIVEPLNGYVYTSATAIPSVLGKIVAPAGIDTFCVTAPDFQVEIPAVCLPGRAVLGPDGSFCCQSVDLPPGVSFINAWVRDNAGNVAGTTIHVQAKLKTQLRVTGIEVTQAVQYDLANLPPPVPLTGLTDIPTPDPAIYGGLAGDWGGLPVRDELHPAAAVPYLGVRLAANRKTIARVFVDSGSIPVNGNPIAVTLAGTSSGGKPLPGSPLLPDFTPAKIMPGPTYTTKAARTNPASAYTFTLPAGWPRGTVDLEAEAHISGISLDTDCDCGVYTHFKLAGISFTPVRSWVIDPLLGEIVPQGEAEKAAAVQPASNACAPALPGKGAADTPCPSAIFDAARIVFPFADNGVFLPSSTRVISTCPPPIFTGRTATAVLCTTTGDPTAIPYNGVIPLTDIAHCTDPAENDCDTDPNNSNGDRAEDALDRLSAATEDAVTSGDTTVIVFQNTIGNILGSSRQDEDTKDREEYSLAVVEDSLQTRRLIYGVMHELGHGLGLHHAGHDCPGLPSSTFLGYGGDSGEFWPPDNQGQIQGIGLDPRRNTPKDPANLNTLGPYPLKVPGQAPTAAGKSNGPYYDLMSYCNGATGDGAVWISTRNWNRLIQILATGPAGSSAAALQNRPRNARISRDTAGPMRVVEADLKATGEVEIDSLRPAVGRVAVPDNEPTTDYHFLARSARGALLADKAAIVDLSHTPTGLGEGMVRAVLPVTSSAASLEVTKNGVVLATRHQSAHPPAVRILSPQRGSRVGRGRFVVLRWQATDADHDPLSISVDYSANNGRTWHTIYVGANVSHAALPSTLFAGSHLARLRVRANDGWDETQAVSAAFTAIGWNPGIVITNPQRGSRLPADAPLYLTGQGNDDQLRPLHGRQLLWYTGQRRLGYGNQLSVTGLRPGRQPITLQARDRTGRVSRVTTFVLIQPAKPRLLTLQAPKRIGPHATHLALRVASTIPAILDIGLKRFHVDRTQRRILLTVKRGSRPLRFRLLLTARNNTSSYPITVRRTR